MKDYTLYPINDQELFEMGNAMEAMAWNTKEVDLSMDAHHFKALRPEEQHFIKQTLAFFAASDGVVNENISLNFLNEVPYKEATLWFYPQQAGNEAIHSKMYSELINSIIVGEEERNSLFKAVETSDYIRAKTEFCLEWMNPNKPLWLRLSAYLAVEGLFFCSSFASIFWIKFRYPGKMPGLVLSNDWIARDETLHTDFSLALLHRLGYDKAGVQRVLNHALKLEQEFISSMLPKPLFGMSVKDMQDYARFTQERLLVKLGVIERVTLANPLPFMDKLGSEVRNNFFENRTSTYQKPDILIKEDTSDAFEW